MKGVGAGRVSVRGGVDQGSGEEVDLGRGGTGGGGLYGLLFEVAVQ